MTAADAIPLFELESDAEVNRYQEYEPMTLEAASKYALEAEESWSAGGFPSWQEFSIRQNGEFVGRVGFEHDDMVGTVWYALRPAVQGQGLGSEAVDAVVEYGFEHGLESYEANCSAENIASTKLLLRCGFAETKSDDTQLRMFRRDRIGPTSLQNAKIGS